MFHKEGHKIIFSALVMAIVLTLIAHFFVEIFWIQKTIQIGSILFLILILQFFRNPSRISSQNDEHVLSPIDGKVVAIEKVIEKEYFNEQRILVSIIMSPVNVHATRYPVSGKVLFSKNHAGQYLNATHPKASDENERNTIVLENNIYGKVLYRQIAGAFAKRVVNYATIGEEVIQGNDAGFIKFGSRVDVFLPLDAKIKVSLNQKVKGGVDVIAD